MGISARDIIPLSHARANFSELAEEVKAGSEKIVTKNGESFIALIASDRLDYYHRLERERIHLLLINEVSMGLDDVAAGRVKDARSGIESIKRRRSACRYQSLSCIPMIYLAQFFEFTLSRGVDLCPQIPTGSQGQVAGDRLKQRESRQRLDVHGLLQHQQLG